MRGTVEVLPKGATAWQVPVTNQVLQPLDRIHTGNNSRVVLLWSDQSVLSFGSSTELEILAPDSAGAQHGLQLFRGVISFFHRDQPGRIKITTRGAVAGVEGTEFVLAVDESDRTELSVVDGTVSLSNAQGRLVLTGGQQAVVELGQAPVRTAGFLANNLLQWSFYYPAVLAVNELELSAPEQNDLAASLAAYQSGNLLRALQQYPSGRTHSSDAERIYVAALYLSVGEVRKAEATLAELADANGRSARFAGALRQLIAAVKRETLPTLTEPQTATECLARSYYEQSRAAGNASLSEALRFAKRATELAPGFGFAWQRVAELELCFGRLDRASAALERGLSVSPNNAQALATKGFVLAAQDQPAQARVWFDRAIAADGGLGNAWLGRGLTRIRLGDRAGGREDLLVAAAQEPQRAELRSYLGKAYVQAGDSAQAESELGLAKRLDPNDPTAWLYSALLNQQRNLINDAIRDLEHSQSLNDNRAVYRSSLLLDQDQAVRQANQATIYKDAGLTDLSVREAARSVNTDYASYSAHLFLAGSYQELQQKEQGQVRYETAVNSEYLLANLLAPASAGPLSPALDQQRRFVPFERHHFGIVSETEYLSRGAWSQSAMQYGIWDNFSYGLSADYLSDPGQYPNNDLEAQTFALKLKWQITPSDSLFAEVLDYRAESGDRGDYYDPAVMLNPEVRIREEQEPTLNLGYHHEWNPGIHTLLYASRVSDDFSFNGRVPAILAARFANETTDPYELVGIAGGISLRSIYRNRVTQYTTELQQIWQQESLTTIAGVRYQYGRLHTSNREDLPTAAAFFDIPAADQDLESTQQRASVYAYEQWQVLDPLRLIGGFSYDWMEFPENLISPPISTREESQDQLSPKAGAIWEPFTNTTVRLAYTRSLGGQNLDQSQRIEPVQVAGFLQTFRSIIGEPSVPQTGAARFDTFNLALDQKFDSGTYLGVNAGILSSKIHQSVGAFDGLWDLYDFAVPGTLREHVKYREKSLQFTVNQLVGRDWVFGADYRVARAHLDDRYVEVGDGVAIFNFQPNRELESTLQSVNLFALYNHPSGFFSQVDGRWNSQRNKGYAPAQPGDEFWQFDAFVGYRFLRRTAELTLGVLNLTDENYKLSPLNYYPDLPRERTFMARLRLSF